MAANRTSNLSLDDTVLLTEKGLVGLDELEDILGMQRYRAATVAPVLAALKAAREALTAAYDAERSAFAEIRTAAAQVQGFLPKMIDRCKGFLGRTYNVTYKQLGLDSLGLPKSHSYRLRVIESMAGYLHSHAALADPAQGLTAAAATGLHAAYRDALTHAATARARARALKDAEQAALQTLRATLRGWIKELSLCLPPLDPRWRTFGLNIPGQQAAPEQVENLIVTPQSAGTLLLAWEAAPRAGRYQVEMLVLPEETEFTRVTTVGATNVVLSDLVPGASVRLRVAAVNEGGPGVPSDAVPAQVPAAQAA